MIQTPAGKDFNHDLIAFRQATADMPAVGLEQESEW